MQLQRVPHLSGNLSTFLPLSNNSPTSTRLEIVVDTKTERAFHCLDLCGLVALPRANTRSPSAFREEQALLGRKFPKVCILSLTQ